MMAVRSTPPSFLLFPALSPRRGKEEAASSFPLRGESARKKEGSEARRENCFFFRTASRLNIPCCQGANNIRVNNKVVINSINFFNSFKHCF
jgi:hypothetical protein